MNKYNTPAAREAIAFLNNHRHEITPAERLLIAMKMPLTSHCEECGNLVLLPYTDEIPWDDTNGFDRELYVDYQGENALCLDFTGGYGEFFDFMEPIKILLCHDCCVCLLHALPHVAEQYFRIGGHPSYDEEVSCCHWGWRFNPVTLDIEVGDGAGGWEKAETPAD